MIFLFKKEMKCRGAILLFSLIVLAMTFIITGALCAYYVNTASVAKFYADERSSRRVGATRALHMTIDNMTQKYDELSNQIQTLPGLVGVAINVKGMTTDEFIGELQSVVPKTVNIENETYDLRTEITATMALRIIASYNGNDITDVLIEFENPIVMNTLPVFDYVYFVDNNGQLNSNYIIANGEVGSNGDFELKGATVNGFINYLGSIQIANQPCAWLQSAYNSKITAEFSYSDVQVKKFEQVRPTNPVVFIENGITKIIEWSGGYEQPHVSNPYSWDEDPPSPPTEVSKPGKEPSEPEKIQRATTSFRTQPLNSQFKEYNP